MIKQNKRNAIIILFFAIILISLLFFYKKYYRIDSVQIKKELVTAPFSFIVMPKDLDDATYNVLQDKITQTKQKYIDYPNEASSWVAIGNLYNTLGDYDHAIESYIKSLDIDGLNILAHRNIAEVYRVHKKQYEKAEEYYKQAIKNNNGDPTLYIALGRLQFKQLADSNRAEQTFIDGLSKTKNDNDILIQLILMYQETRNQDKLKLRVAQLLEANPNNQIYKEEWGKILE